MVKNKKFSISIFLYIAAVIVALIGVALLVNNILLFKNALTQYVGQGYSAATVRKQLIPSQLIPGIFQPVAVYGGIAFLLLCAGIINKKVSTCMSILTKDTSEEIINVEEQDMSKHKDNMEEQDTSKDENED